MPFRLSIYLFTSVLFCGLLGADSPFKVISVQGKVQYRAPKSLSLIDVQKHHGLEAKGRLKLAEGAKIELMSQRGDQIIFEDQSYIKLSNYAEQDQQSETMIDLYRGKAHFKVKPLKEKSSFGVRTASCVAGVRGTEFTVTDSQVIVMEGEVEVVPHAAPDISIPVTTGKTATVSTTGEVEVAQTTSSDGNNTSANSNDEKNSKEKSIQEEVDQQQEQREAEELFQLKVRINDHD
jgi:hypothetical protein